MPTPTASSPPMQAAAPVSKAISKPARAPHDDLSWLAQYRARFVVFEGPDGSGKSTQFRRLADTAKARGIALCEVREPGGTPVGERIRDVLLARVQPGMDMTLRCEMLLYMASRAELVERRIRPALKAGELVLADRFVASTLAYQGAAGGLTGADISAVARVATQNLQPDLVVIFDLDETAAAKRLSPLLDRMEAKGAAFHRKVRQGYLDLAKGDPSRYATVDASKDAETVWQSLCATMADRAAHLAPKR
ncbi:MAG: dTMP kinase [Phycisphaeraceae bacterium]|nr:dTMP kinase [Phycisphaeraceae bacterium]